MQMTIDPGNPSYFAVGGKPALLLGGSDEDNPFQWTEDVLLPQLDALSECGGNFIRNTMSDRDPGNVVPFARQDKRYRLDQWNETYWQRLDCFLDETAGRGIHVQVTLWDQHDLAGKRWETHYWNPRNNNIGLDESELYRPNDFFSTVRKRNALVLPYQMKFVRRIMDHCLAHEHVCYNICNEGWAGLEWECYWAHFLRKVAGHAGREVWVTTMEHGPDMSVEAVTQNPHLFDYVELSQLNNASTGYAGRQHYEHLLRLRTEVRRHGRAMPIQMEKIYGRDATGTPSFGDTAEAVRKFWQIIFAGCASARFHRPDGGLGLSEQARRQIRMGRAFAETFDLFSSRPVCGVDAREACVLRDASGAFAAYLPVPEPVTLRADTRPRHVTWMSIDAGSRVGPRPARPDERGKVVLRPPGEGPWVAVTD